MAQAGTSETTVPEYRNDADVLIIGGGPVGMGLAIELGQRGIRCVVVERHKQIQRIPKGQNLTQRTMEHFSRWGAEKQLRDARTIPPEYGIGGLTAYGTLLGRYSHDWLQRDLVRPYYYTANERLPQYATEAVLRARAEELDTVQTLFGWNAENVSQDDNGVSVAISERGGNERHTLRASYAVGCDGAHSSVRQQIGLSQTQTDHDRLMVLLVFRSIELHRLLERFPGKSYYKILHPELKGYWKFLGRVDLGHTWFFHAPVPLGTTAANFDFHGYLQEAIGASFSVEFEHIGFWDLRFALADSYRKGRVFIAGDAAHSHPPYGGYGVNSGLEDARNLGWKLAAAVQGWGTESLLDSYDAERRTVFRSTIDDFISKSIDADNRFLNAYSPEHDREAFEKAWMECAQGAAAEVQAFEPNYEGSPVVWQEATAGRVCSAKGSHRFEARPGHHLAPAVLSSDGNVYEALGTGFTLLAVGAAPEAVHSFAKAAARLKIPLSVIQVPLDGEVMRYKAPLILVRPDDYVSWVGVSPDVSEEQVSHILRIARAAEVH